MVKLFDHKKTAFAKMLPLEVFKQNLLKGDYDHHIFSKPYQKEKAISELILHDNRLVAQRLMTYCTSEETLNFWLTQGVKMPTDALALGIVLRADPCVFAYLEKEDFFADLDETETQKLLKRAKVYLSKHEASLNYFQEAIVRQQNKQTFKAT